MKNLLFLNKIEVCDGLTIIEGYNKKEDAYQYYANEVKANYFVFGVPIDSRFDESDIMALFHNGYFDAWIKL